MLAYIVLPANRMAICYDFLMKHSHWPRLALMIAISFVAMFVLMYMMVDRFDNALLNLNQLYMALTMTAAMVVIELTVMSYMYGNKLALGIVAGVAVVALGVFFMFTRRQVAITDQQFLRSMIPHHGAAILMCEQAKLTDPEIQKLCANIRRTQQAEIDFMKSKLLRDDGQH